MQRIGKDKNRKRREGEAGHVGGAAVGCTYSVPRVPIHRHGRLEDQNHGHSTCVYVYFQELLCALRTPACTYVGRQYDPLVARWSLPRYWSWRRPLCMCGQSRLTTKAVKAVTSGHSAVAVFRIQSEVLRGPPVSDAHGHAQRVAAVDRGRPCTNQTAWPG